MTLFNKTRNPYYLFGITVFSLLLATCAVAQNRSNYSYAAQKKFIPVELGQVYLGMPFKDIASKFALSKADVDGRFDFVLVTVPIQKGKVDSFSFKVQGISESDKTDCLRSETVTQKGEFGDYEEIVGRIIPEKVPKAAFIYEIDVKYNDGFDLYGLVVKTFGPTKDVYKKSDEFYIYDLQWTKTTPDKLVWLIRYFKDSRTLQLSGRITGTEWSIDDIQ